MDELRSNLTWMIRYFKGKINKSCSVYPKSIFQRMNPIKQAYHLEDVANTIIDVAEAEISL